MSVIDKDGRVFGRLNLVDAAIIALIALLIPIGYAAYLLFRPERPSIESVTRVEIGNEERRVSSGTILTAKLKVRGTGFNRRVKAMMLERAFSSGFRRVEFRVDRRNARSQAAMKKLGAVREGVLRADRITWTGHVRDTVLFAILKDEWQQAE